MFRSPPPDQEMLTREVAVWEHKRNQDAVKVNWRFTTEMQG